MENMVEKFLFDGIYSNKRVLITGHTGFKGSWLSYWLELMGAKIMGISKEYLSDPDHFSRLNLKTESIIGDIRDYGFIKKEISLFKPEIIFHMAAQPIVSKSFENPIETFNTNLIGTLNLFEASRENKISKIINVTSDKVYENDQSKNIFIETDKLGGSDIYSSSKACVELMTRAYRETFLKYNEIKIINVRSGNLIGGGDWGENRLIPDIVKSIIKNKEVEIRNLDSVRPWQHVLSTLSGYLILGEKLLKDNKIIYDEWNFGPLSKSKFTVNHILEIFKKEWPELKVKSSNLKFPESKFLMINSANAREKIKWDQVWDFKNSIEKTISWYRSYIKKDQIDTKQQIFDFINESKIKGLKWAIK